MFLLYINDISTNIGSSIRLFADTPVPVEASTGHALSLVFHRCPLIFTVLHHIHNVCVKCLAIIQIECVLKFLHSCSKVYNGISVNNSV